MFLSRGYTWLNTAENVACARLMRGLTRLAHDTQGRKRGLRAALARPQEARGENEITLPTLDKLTPPGTLENSSSRKI